jgi:hypothetical protein
MLRSMLQVNESLQFKWSSTRNTFFSCLSLGEFERVRHLAMAHEIWSTLEKSHEGNHHLKTRLFETYRREYESFVQSAGETIDIMFLGSNPS